MILKNHLNNIENLLKSQSKIASNTGHSIHKGTPREAFVKEFLSNHLPEIISFGTGEIIDSTTDIKERRNQNDVVLYKKNYPKIDFGGGINGFFKESVIATIEIKSKLTENELFKALNSIAKTKSLKGNVVNQDFFEIEDSYKIPSILSYIVAYDGPTSMQTVYNWLNDYITKKSINYIDFQNKNSVDKANIVNPLVDMIIIIGKGVILFDGATNLSFITPIQRKNEAVKKNDFNWIIVDQEENNIFLLFMYLTNLFAHIRPEVMNVLPYLNNSGVSIPTPLLKK